MIKMNSKNTILISLCLVSATLLAQTNKSPKTIIDHGGDSALKYYESLNIDNNLRAVIKIPLIKVKPITETSMLPIVSKKLSPGKVEPRIINTNGLIRPFFMVGDDKFSIEWLKQRATALEKLQAVGLVVSVKNAKSYNQIKQLAPNLMILPISGDDIADRLGLSHYPVLITATAIEQ